MSSFTRAWPVIILSWASLARANHDCTCDATAGGHVREARSAQGKELRVRFPSSPVTTEAREAFACRAPASAVASAQLWMPGMGHGSSPLRWTESAAGCTRLDKVNFVMAGAWEVRLAFADGDTAVVPVTVEEP